MDLSRLSYPLWNKEQCQQFLNATRDMHVKYLRLIYRSQGSTNTKIIENSFYLVPVGWHYIYTLFIIIHRCMCIHMWQLTKQSFHWLTDGRMILPWLILKEVQYHILQNKDPRYLHLFLINSVWQNECICCLSHYTTDLN